jgi:hypothetical protein
MPGVAPKDHTPWPLGYQLGARSERDSALVRWLGMRLLRRRSRLAIVLGVGALAAGAAAGAIVAAHDDGSRPAAATTGEYAPITVSRQALQTAGGALLSDPEAGVQVYLTTVVTQLPGKHRYRITISNTSNVGFINSFEWHPPSGIRIMRLVGESEGRCVVSGLTGFGGNQFKSVVLYPNISCHGIRLKPPRCTCLGDGGSMSFAFVADRPMGLAGTARMTTATLTYDPIPSYLKSAPTAQNGSAASG